MRVVATADSPLCFTQYLYGVYDGDQTWHHGVVTLLLDALHHRTRAHPGGSAPPRRGTASCICDRAGSEARVVCFGTTVHVMDPAIQDTT